MSNRRHGEVEFAHVNCGANMDPIDMARLPRPAVGFVHATGL
ncbi:hypothetical protein FBZ33_1980 [Micromonospora sp. A202]|nr:hypothetical protein FBZ33_1980 [Micromonospora sp. A202]